MFVILDRPEAVGEPCTKISIRRCSKTASSRGKIETESHEIRPIHFSTIFRHHFQEQNENSVRICKEKCYPVQYFPLSFTDQ